MKKLKICAIATIVLFNSCNYMNNPILEESKNPFQAPAFDKIKIEHYMPAFEFAINKARNEIDEIINNPDSPSFENTIEALERSGKELDNVASIFFNLKEVITCDQMDKIAEDVTPKLTELSLYSTLNLDLFEKIKQVYGNRENLNLSQEQLQLLKETYKSFSRNGADLSEDKKEIYSKIAEKLPLASLKFGQNQLAETNKFILHLTDETDLDGLPSFVKDMGASEAKSKDLEGWVYTLQYPSYGPFMQYSNRRDLREKIWMAYNTKCTQGEHNNQDIVTEITSLRIESANLLGYETHADYVLEENMTKNKKVVTIFLDDLLEKSLPFGKKDIKAIEKYAQSNGLKGKLMPWDFSLYTEKYKHEKYSLNDEILKPYFQLENVEKAIFELANKLYDIKIEEVKNIPLYHEEVKTFTVKEKNGEFLALLYIDYFPRASKSSGAWMTSFRDQSIDKNGIEERPFISLVCNFTKPTENMPSLLTFNEVVTLLHEFGHGLHGIFAKGSYVSLTGTSVAQDFVELPSQIMENWAYEAEFLASFAKHYQTGKIIPQDLINKIIESKNFLSGYSQVRQLSLGITDMSWHTLTKPENGSVINFEADAIKRAQLMPFVDGSCISTSFGHIFAGGYSAGYYSYKWAEVLEADSYSLFKEKGIFNKEIAKSFRDNILSRGSIEDADVIYRNFRGRDPQPEALMIKLGLTK